MKRCRLPRALLASAPLWLALAGCESRDVHPIPWDFERMVRQPRYEAYRESSFFSDGRAMREPPEGTVPRTDPDAGPAEAPPADLALLERGRGRFGIACAPCHGLDGRAQTQVARVMSLRAPPSLFEREIRTYDAAAIHRVIRQGYGLMPSYAPLLSERDAWAVAYYVKALQLSQSARLDALPDDLRARAERALASEAPR